MDLSVDGWIDEDDDEARKYVVVSCFGAPRPALRLSAARGRRAGGGGG